MQNENQRSWVRSSTGWICLPSRAASTVSPMRVKSAIREQGLRLLDVLVIAPCTGNTLAKLAAGVTDTPVTMAAKAHLRNDRPKKMQSIFFDTQRDAAKPRPPCALPQQHRLDLPALQGRLAGAEELLLRALRAG